VFDRDGARLWNASIASGAPIRPDWADDRSVQMARDGRLMSVSRGVEAAEAYQMRRRVLETSDGTIIVVSETAAGPFGATVPDIRRQAFSSSGDPLYDRTLSGAGLFDELWDATMGTDDVTAMIGVGRPGPREQTLAHVHMPDRPDGVTAFLPADERLTSARRIVPVRKDAYLLIGRLDSQAWRHQQLSRGRPPPAFRRAGDELRLSLFVFDSPACDWRSQYPIAPSTAESAEP